MKLRLIAVAAVGICIFGSAAEMACKIILPDALNEVRDVILTDKNNIKLLSRPVNEFRASEKAEYAHIVMSEPGTLDSSLGDLKLVIDSISIEGSINESDFRTLWESSFYGCLKVINLEKAVLGDGRIPDKAFFHLEEQRVPSTQFVTLYTIHLKSIILPEGLKEIGECAFSYAISLKNVNFPKTLRKIGKSAFNDCIGLTTDALTFNDGLELIDTQAFYQSQLSGPLKIPSSVRVINRSAFYHCPITEVNLPENLEYLGGMAFEGSNFKSIAIPDGCVLADNGYQFYGNKNLTEVRLPADLKYIPDGIFDCCNLLGSIELPLEIVRIGEGAFYETALVEVTLPERVETIGNDAFRSCVMLEKITLPASVMSLGCSAFDNCPRLKSICSMSPVPPECINESEFIDFAPVFSGFPHDIPVYVPVGSGDLYRNAPGWDYLTNFIETEFSGSSVDAVSVDSSFQDALYDLNGHRITVPASCQPYIRNGKKHIRK